MPHQIGRAPARQNPTRASPSRASSGSPGQEQPPAGQAPSHQHQAEGQPQQQGGARLSPIDRPPPQAEGELIFQGIRRAAIHKLHQQGAASMPTTMVTEIPFARLEKPP